MSRRAGPGSCSPSASPGCAFPRLATSRRRTAANRAVDLPCGSGPTVTARRSRAPDAGAGDAVRPREPPADGPRGLRRSHHHRRGQPRAAGGAPRWGVQGHNPAGAARHGAQHAGRAGRRGSSARGAPPTARSRSAPAPSPTWPWPRTTTPAGRRSLNGALSATSAARRVATGLGRSGRIRRHGRHDLPCRRLVPAGPARRRLLRGRAGRLRVGAPGSATPAAGTRAQARCPASSLAIVAASSCSSRS